VSRPGRDARHIGADRGSCRSDVICAASLRSWCSLAGPCSQRRAGAPHGNEHPRRRRMGHISNLASRRLLLGRATPPRFEPATNCRPPASLGRASSQGPQLALGGSSASLRSVGRRRRQHTRHRAVSAFGRRVMRDDSKAASPRLRSTACICSCRVTGRATAWGAWVDIDHRCVASPRQLRNRLTPSTGSSNPRRRPRTGQACHVRPVGDASASSSTNCAGQARRAPV
jgi:hypothetical protein